MVENPPRGTVRKSLSLLRVYRSMIVTSAGMFNFCELLLIHGAGAGIIPPSCQGPQEGEGGVWGDPKYQSTISWICQQHGVFSACH